MHRPSAPYGASEASEAAAVTKSGSAWSCLASPYGPGPVGQPDHRTPRQPASVRPGCELRAPRCLPCSAPCPLSHQRSRDPLLAKYADVVGSSTSPGVWWFALSFSGCPCRAQLWSGRHAENKNTVKRGLTGLLIMQFTELLNSKRMGHPRHWQRRAAHRAGGFASPQVRASLHDSAWLARCSLDGSTDTVQ